LLLDWLSKPRQTVGDIAYLRKPGAEEEDVAPVPLSKLRRMRRADYVELRIERRSIVVLDAADRRRIKVIREALKAVITELKAVIAY
jgi:hypothetical protein